MPKTFREIEVKRLVNQAEEEGQAEAGWLATMADMMTLLLTFFVMLLALAAPDTERYLEAMQEVGSAMGGASYKDKLRKDMKKKESQLKEFLKTMVQDSNLVKDVQITSDTRGVVLYSRGDFFFPSGSSQVKEETKLFLNKVADVIKGTQGRILIEGHTDDIPISTEKFPSNWELSTARAASVARYFIEEHRIDPERFVVAGYGSYKPRFIPTPENRPRNRRVEIVMLRQKNPYGSDEGEAPPNAPSAEE